MKKAFSQILLLFALFLITGILNATTTLNETENIQDAINALPSKGGTIYLNAGTYILKKELHIDKSNVTINGERGTLLKLADNANQPVILIGTDKETPTTKDIIQNIHISNIEIDGNKKNQTSEFDSESPWLRNNGIDIRAVDNLWIDKVDIHNARSGALVASWKSQRIFITNSSFHNDYFDGIALYDSKDIHISNFLTYENNGAGISLDNDLKHIIFSNGIVKNNKDVGIFVRDSEDIAFNNLMVMENGNHGVFMSHSAYNNTPEGIISDSGVKRLFFSGCSFIKNKGYGILLASPSKLSPDNTVIGCLFAKNTVGSIKHPDGGLHKTANVYQ